MRCYSTASVCARVCVCARRPDAPDFTLRNSGPLANQQNINIHRTASVGLECGGAWVGVRSWLHLALLVENVSLSLRSIFAPLQKNQSIGKK